MHISFNFNRNNYQYPGNNSYNIKMVLTNLAYGSEMRTAVRILIQFHNQNITALDAHHHLSPMWLS